MVGLLDVRWHLVGGVNVLLYGASECFCTTVHWEGDLVYILFNVHVIELLCYRLTHLCILHMLKHFGMANTKKKIPKVF
jgi:hypothetical protein